MPHYSKFYGSSCNRSKPKHREEKERSVEPEECDIDTLEHLLGHSLQVDLHLRVRFFIPVERFVVNIFVIWKRIMCRYGDNVLVSVRTYRRREWFFCTESPTSSHCTIMLVFPPCSFVNCTPFYCFIKFLTLAI